MAELSKDDLKTLLEEFFGSRTTGTKVDPKDLDSLMKSVKDVTAEQRKSLSVSKAFGNIITGTKVTLDDFGEVVKKQTKDLDKTLESLERELKKAVAAGDAARQVSILETRAKIEEEKQIRTNIAASKQTGAALINLGAGMVNFTSAMLTAAIDFAKGLQSGASGTQVFGKAMRDTVKASGDLTKTIFDTVSALFGVAAIFLPIGRAAKVLLGGLSGLATFLGFTFKKSADLSVEALEFFSNEIENAKKSWQEMTSAGANFSRGIDQIREYAGKAGMDMAMFSRAVKESQTSLAAMGIGVTEAAKRMADVRGVIKASKTLDDSFRRLGYDAVEQGKLAAETMAMLAVGSRKEAYSKEQVANLTLDYGKSLRIMSDITGKDAKKAMEKARLDSMTSAAMAAAAKGGPEATLRMQTTLANMPAELQKGFLEYFVSGGTAITDLGTNLAISQNNTILPAFKTWRETILSSGLSLTEITKQTQTINEQIGAQQLKSNIANGSMFQAAQLSGNSHLTALTTITNALTVVGTTQIPGAAAKVETTVTALSTSTGKLNQTIIDIDKKADELRVALMNKITPALGTYATTLLSSGKVMESWINHVNDMITNMKAWSDDIISKSRELTGEPQGPSLWERMHEMGKFGSGVGTVAGGIAGGVAGAAAGGVGAIPGALGGAAVGGVTGYVVGAGVGAAQHAWEKYGPGSPASPGNAVTGMRGRPDDPARYAGLNIQGKYPGEAIAGGAANDRIIAAAKKLNTAYPGGRFNAFNDATHPPGSPHGRGQAMDWKPPAELMTKIRGNPGAGKEFLQTMSAMGFSNSKDEINERSPGWNGEHIHGEAMANGGIVSPSSGGLNATIGEGGRSELVTPLKNGRIPGMDELIDRFDTMISVMKTVGSNTDKMYKAVA